MYRIEASDDENSWHTVYKTVNGDGGVDDVDVSALGRYVRMQGVERGSPYGYTSYKFGVTAVKLKS